MKNKNLDELTNQAQELNMGYDTDQKIEGLREHCSAANKLFDKAFDLPESEVTKIADEIRARHSEPVDVSVRLRRGEIHLLKSAILQPPTNPAEKKYMLDLQKLTEKELAAHLVKIAVRKVVSDYAVGLVNPSN